MNPTDTDTDGARHGSLSRRLLSMVYDGIVLLGLLMIASALALPFGGAGKVAFRDPGFTAWLALVTFAYFGACWRYSGMTVGMRAWRVRLISARDGPVSWWQCLVRFCVAFVSLGLAGCGFWWALADRKNRTWHDLASGTLLIRT